MSNEDIAGLAFAHGPAGRASLTLGSVQFVSPDTFPRTTDAMLHVIYNDTDDTLENTAIDKRARDGSDPVEALLTFDELDALLASPHHTIAGLGALANPKTFCRRGRDNQAASAFWIFLLKNQKTMWNHP